MIVALYALSAAMMIGGIASVIQGFPFVRLESGLAMTIAGAGVASAGAVLFGLGVVASRLKRVEEALSFRRLADEARPTVSPSAAGGAVFVPPTVAPPAPPPAIGAPAAALAGLAGGGLAGAALGGGLASGRAGREPVFDGSTFGTFAPDDPSLPEYGPADAHPTEHALSEPPAPEPFVGEPDEAEPELPLPTPPMAAVAPLPLPEAPLDLPHEPEPSVAPEDDLFASPEPAPEASREPEAPASDEPSLGLRPALGADSAPAIEPEPAPHHETVPEPEPIPAAAPAREVVGTYASGGNTYVMYSDGAIEAETPRGRFSFGSLDELKAFVDAGGEADRGAA